MEKSLIEKEYEKIIKHINFETFYGGTDRIKLLKRVLAVLDNPQHNFNIIHVAGTNGKGSTCEMINRILIKRGFKAGIFTSPHLYDSRERIVVNEKMISKEAFINCYHEISAKIAQIGLTVDDLSDFEWHFIIAIYYFYQQKVDFAVLETGLGGELDATNAVDNTMIVAFTKIDLDHTNVLGSTIKEIATTKSKIIKNRCAVVNYCNQDSVASEVIKAECDKNEATYYLAEIKNLEVLEEDISKSVINIETSSLKLNNLKLNLAGYYQIYNLATVLSMVEILNAKGFNISEDNISEALKDIKFAGRMEIINDNPKVIIDGAHNPNGISGLIKSLNRYNEEKKYIFVLGFLKDKNFIENLELIMPYAKFLVLTEPNNQERHLSLEELETAVNEVKKKLGVEIQYYKEKDINDAVILAKKLSKPTDLICCAGSFYLIKEIAK